MSVVRKRGRQSYLTQLRARGITDEVIVQIYVSAGDRDRAGAALTAMSGMFVPGKRVPDIIRMIEREKTEQQP